MIYKIISGGQPGVEFGALVAGRLCKIKTGGWVPNNFVTEAGRVPKLRTVYGCRATKVSMPSQAIVANIMQSDATLVIAQAWDAPEVETAIRVLRNTEKPYVCVTKDDPWDYIRLGLWMEQHDVYTLNVTGNQEKSAPGIKQFTESYIERLVMVQRGQMDESKFKTFSIK